MRVPWSPMLQYAIWRAVCDCAILYMSELFGDPSGRCAARLVGRGCAVAFLIP